jgi:hypothetical protein
MILEMSGNSDENYIDGVYNGFELQDAIVIEQSLREVY